MKRIAILGSTGSIGLNTIDVISRLTDYEVVGLAAGSNAALLAEQIKRFRPRLVSIAEPSMARELRSMVTGLDVEIVDDAAQVAAMAEAELVVAAIVGAAGLAPTMAAVRAGKTIALANKETLVMAGALVTREARQRGVRILPVDSEHSAIFQALAGDRSENVRRLILTASGGPFRSRTADELDNVTVEEALSHPSWNMGDKITIDSATLMNKGLEVIEAHWLFGVPVAQIDIAIHPECAVHSMVEYVDGSIVAQLGPTDMRGPIAYALCYPQRLDLGLERLDLLKLGTLHFQAPDPERFPAYRLAYQAVESGDTAPAILNAANEVAVKAFLTGRIPFTAIWRISDSVLNRVASGRANTLEDIWQADRAGREAAERLVNSGGTGS